MLMGNGCGSHIFTKSRKRFLCIFVIFLLCMLIVTGQSAAATPPQAEHLKEHNILFINSYGYDFETVPIIITQVESALKDTASIQYLFMNEKYVDYKVAEQKLTEELDLLSRGYKYDVVILGDDAAFDFAIKNREKYFQGIPLIFENVNSVTKAAKYQKDPLISGIVEEFSAKETIELARTIQKQAKKVVIITDNSISGAGSAEQIMAQQKNFPDLTFEIFDCSKMTSDEIKKNIATYSNEAILIYTVFNVDKANRRYTIAQGIKMITDAARVPVFKADEAGMGSGLLGGYQLSYASIGRKTVDMVKEVLTGKLPLPPYEKGQSVYQFDKKVMNKYGISKKDLPKGAIYFNDEPTFYDKYRRAVWLVVLVAIILLVKFRQRQVAYNIKIAENKMRLETERAANQAKTMFLSRMSHDIRTPLNGIIGMTYLAQQEQNPPGTEDALNKIDNASKFLLDLINDILDMTKVESNKIELHPEPMDFEGLKQALDAVIVPMCQEKNITYKTEFLSTGPYLPLFDNLRIKQVYFNLLSNAVKYNRPNGTIFFKIVNKVAEDKKHIVCDAEISDTGIGMGQEFLKVLFEPFTQENHEENLKKSGTGLGLAIAKKMVELMNGTILVESKLGQGTTFRLHFVVPCLPVTALQRKKPASISEADNVEILQGKHILICDDQMLNREIAKRILEKVGMEITLTNNGKEALDAFEQSEPGFYQGILMDIRMPEMDGLAATKAIRNLKREDAKTVAIIAMSANAFEEDVQLSLAAGMNEHLSKPINPRQVYQTIAKYM